MTVLSVRLSVKCRLLGVSFGGVKICKEIFGYMGGLAPLNPPLFKGQLYFFFCLKVFKLRVFPSVVFKNFCSTENLNYEKIQTQNKKRKVCPFTHILSLLPSCNQLRNLVCAHVHKCVCVQKKTDPNTSYTP